MKLTALEIAKINRGLQVLEKKNLDVDDAWNVLDNKEEAAPTIRKYEGMAMKIFNKFAVESEKGKEIPVENIEKHNEEMSLAGAKEEEVNFKKLNVGVLKDENGKVNVGLLGDLKKIIER